jgi:hypothetical protein
MQTAKTPYLPYYDNGDAIDYLRRQHREIDRLLGALVEAPGEHRGRLLADAGDLLAVHLAVEERVFYPGLAPGQGAADDDRPFVVLAVEDHFDIKRALAELLGLDPRARSMTARASLLRERLRAHTEAEERLYPRIRRRIGRTRLRRLEYDMRVLEFEIRTDDEPRRLVVEDAADADADADAIGALA